MKCDPFDWFYNTAVIIARYDTDDYSGEKKRSVLGTVKADIQPYSSVKAREAYGVEIECQKRMFCKADPNISFENHIEISGEIYEITHKADWDMGLEVMLRRVRPK